jgi:hypothetical protein
LSSSLRPSASLWWASSRWYRRGCAASTVNIPFHRPGGHVGRLREARRRGARSPAAVSRLLDGTWKSGQASARSQCLTKRQCSAGISFVTDPGAAN